MAYKGSGKKARIQGSVGSGTRRSQIGIGGPGSFAKQIQNIGSNSKKQSGSGGNSRKTHDTKGKNNHGRTSGWF
jgi:hypothetical protein